MFCPSGAIKSVTRQFIFEVGICLSRGGEKVFPVFLGKNEFSVFPVPWPGPSCACTFLSDVAGQGRPKSKFQSRKPSVESQCPCKQQLPVAAGDAEVEQ